MICFKSKNVQNANNQANLYISFRMLCFVPHKIDGRGKQRDSTVGISKTAHVGRKSETLDEAKNIKEKAKAAVEVDLAKRDAQALAEELFKRVEPSA
jgi:hypothetical protein